MWTYHQRTGELRHDGELVATGYAGHGEGKNNPDLQAVHNVGPIPRGNWLVQGPPRDGTTHGPYVLRLEPFPETETCGRSGFLLHGDSVSDPGTASLGCICMPPTVRRQVWESGDHGLVVVNEEMTR